MKVSDIFKEQIRIMDGSNRLFYFIEYPSTPDVLVNTFNNIEVRLSKVIYPMTKRDKKAFLEKYDWDGSTNNKLPRLYVK